MKQIEAQGTALHKHQQAQEVSETCSQLAPPDTSGVFGTETRAPGPSLSCFDLVLPLRLCSPPEG